ncbi:hypothetical protein [Paludisphaera mucosa]|uniref:Uncharacterized protein n=1 Tax=Paludisphaera mucosa TaxID=3030827 RepID=A0ABT6FLX4_9BACT|nr:hypothetical protein [Paludisphaera mucosa]MDG3008383.1 hypothetical protein [Paludisphaera mucosa]
MKQLIEVSTDKIQLAFTRYGTSKWETALAQARRLMDLDDPDERVLGERLRAEVMKESRTSQRGCSRPFVDFAIFPN